MDIRTAARALGGDVAGRNRIRCPGPGHSRHDRSLAVTFNGDGTFVTHSFAMDDWRECRDLVKARLGLSDEHKAPAPVDVGDYVDFEEVLDRKRRIATAEHVWNGTVPLAGTLAERYLSSRGLAYDGEALRFHPGARAMVALMTDAATGEPCGVHRTFLDASGGKIDRKMLGAKGVVRLSADDEVTYGLAIAEGIETALAAPFRPVWACLDAGNLAKFPVLSGIEALTIFADNDASGTGQKAANACGERWHAAGREVTIRIVDAIGADYADALREEAA